MRTINPAATVWTGNASIDITAIHDAALQELLDADQTSTSDAE